MCVACSSCMVEQCWKQGPMKRNQIGIFRGLVEIMHTCKNDESLKMKVESLFEEFSEQKSFLEYFRNT